MRPGDARASTAVHQMEAVEEALARLPRSGVELAELLVRTDSAPARASCSTIHDASAASRLGWT